MSGRVTHSCEASALAAPFQRVTRPPWVYPLTIQRLQYHQEILPWAPGPWTPTVAVFMVTGRWPVGSSDGADNTEKMDESLQAGG